MNVCFDQKRMLWSQRHCLDQMKFANFLADYFDRSFLIPNTSAVKRILIHMKAKIIEVMIEQRRIQNE